MNRFNTRSIEKLLVAAIITIAGPCLAQQSPLAVSVAQPIQTQTADVDFRGTLEPAQTAEVRAATDGRVDKVLVKDGDAVTEGQLLVQLDHRELHRKIEAANVAIGKLKADFDQLAAKADAAKKKSATVKDSEETAAQIDASRDVVAATLEVKEVERQQLQSELEATKIAAPLAGRIRQLSLRPGDAVHSSPNSATLVCTIAQTDPARACFDVDQTTLSELRTLQRGNPVNRGEEQATAARKKPLVGTFSMAIGSDREFDYRGQLDYLGSRADNKTGQVRACAVFPNRDGSLDVVACAKDKNARAVRIRFAWQLPRKVLMVADLAVGRDRDGRSFVLTVNDAHRIEVRRVELGPRHRGMQAIESGLTPEQWVVIGTPVAALNPTGAAFAPIDFTADLRFASLRSGETVSPVRVPMPRPGKTLRDTTREEIERH
ncbi:MAG: efflux RND transporter periplasmic adaptor subunit [Pirellulales bacterium]|nr:efflux RND transporter periplasmic adaptor subunit [Pirellulales bacterium]